MNQAPYGATRNLTKEFIRLRNDAKRARPSPPEDKETSRLVAAALKGGAADVEMGTPLVAGFSPPWVLKAEKIRADMGLLKDRLTKLKEVHGKSLLVTFDADNEAQNHIDAITREVQTMIKRLDADIRSVVTGPAGDGEQEIREQVQRQLAQALFKLSVDFRKEETRFLNKVEGQKGLAAGSTLGLIEDDTTRAAMADFDPGFTQAQLARVDMSHKLIEERDDEIRKIVETISELAQIMRDLSTLVVEQGTMLDRIDTNISTVAVKIEEGTKEIEKAEQTQKKGRMFLCIIALIVMIVIMLIIVIVRHAT